MHMVREDMFLKCIMQLHLCAIIREHDDAQCILQYFNLAFALL
jgi:hypothetical protein